MANNTTRTPAPSVSPALSSASAQTPPLSPATAPASAPSPALSPASAPTPAPSPASAPVPALSSAPPQTAAVSPASIQTSALYLALSPSPTLSPASSPTPAFSPASSPLRASSRSSSPTPALSPASHPAPALSPASHPAPAFSSASHPAPALSPASHPASGLSPASHPTSGLSPASTPYSVVYCKLCLSEQPLAATSKLRTCDCVFCTPCLQQYVQLAIRDGGGSPVTCPDMACEKVGALLDSEIACFVSAEQVELYQRLKFERGVQLDPGKAWCPVLECQAVCTVRPTTEGQPTSVPCLACQAVFCSGCRGPWESGHSCPELQPMTSFSSDGRAQSSSEADMPIKQCPICGVYIERNQGCAQMLCKSCKHTFCWYCLQSLDGDIFLRHYDKGPCKNKLGHSRASVMWNRTQVVGILVGVSVIVLVTSPLLLLASPCILGCMCKPCGGSRKRRGRKRTEHGQKDLNS